MFEQFKAMGAIAALMKDKDRLRQQVEEFKEKTASISVTGSAGGGAVRVTVSGQLRVTGVQLDPALVAGLQHGDGGRTMAQVLIADAVNDAMGKAQAMVHEEADRRARDLGLPGLPGLTSMLG